MRVSIENYRGISFADFTVDGITLVAAPNASGKTSIAQAVAAALNATPLPVPGMTKTMAGFLVRSGATAGFAQVANDNDPDSETQALSRIEWPKAVIATEGADPPSASTIATGADSLVDMDRTKRTAYLMELLEGAPTKDHLARELKKVGITKPEHIDALWQNICEIGWDNAYSQARDKGAKLKGQWEMVTGERYGSKKAESWLPSDWDPCLDGESEESLQRALVKEQESLEAAIAADAVDHAKRAEHEERAAKIDELKACVEALEADKEKARGLLEQAQEALSHNPAPTAAPQTTPCPCCGEELIISGRQLRRAGERPDEDDLKRRQQAHDDAKAEVQKASQSLHIAQDGLRDAQRQLAQAQASRKWLTEHPLTEGKAASEVDIELARERVAQAERLLNSWKAKTQADRLHDTIEKNQAVIDILAPGGLRQTVLTDKTRQFVADHVTPLTKAAKWRDIAFDRDLTISYGGRIYSLLSESEKFRVRASLQVAIARLQGAPMVVIDAADILDREGRAGLMRMLHTSGMRCLVCMTYQSMDDLPNMAKLPNGCAVWIEDGRAEIIKQ